MKVLLLVLLVGIVTGFPVVIVSNKRSPRRSRALSAASADEQRGEPKTPDDDAPNLDLSPALDYPNRLPSKTGFRCGFVSILGAPNMGKSTILNALLQEDLCIATRRPQTTRHAILGVMTSSEAQVCLFDTPGIIEDPAYKLQEGMMEAVITAFRDADVLLLVTDLFSTPIPDDELFLKVQESKLPVIVVINKIDLVGKANRNFEEEEELDKTYSVPEAIARWRSLVPNTLAIIPCAGSYGPRDKGIEMLRSLLLGNEDLGDSIRAMGRPIDGMFQPGVKFISEEVAKDLLPAGPALYPEESLSDRPERFFASELIRETIFELLRKELPYCCEVRIDSFKDPRPEDKKQVTKIGATIVVERDSQKVIVVGKAGAQVKEVGTIARQKLEEFLQSKVYLQLTVKVEKNWRANEQILQDFGYMRSKG